MDFDVLERRIISLSKRGIISKETANEIISKASDFPEKSEPISLQIDDIEKMNDEDVDFFIKLNQKVNEILYKICP